MAYAGLNRHAEAIEPFQYLAAQPAGPEAAPRGQRYHHVFLRQEDVKSTQPRAPTTSRAKGSSNSTASGLRILNADAV